MDLHIFTVPHVIFQLMRNLTYDGTCFEKSLSLLLSNYVYNALKNRPIYGIAIDRVN